jgi:phytoene dehydrogenase-like protein
MIIIGGGIAGLCAGVYARKSGFATQILEMHKIAGGLATAWKRGGYTFENCIHWLVGSKKGADLNGWWREVFDIDRITFYDSPIQSMHEHRGRSITIHCDNDLLEKELLTKAPEDAAEIIGIFEKRYPGSKAKIEVADVATPATVIRYTNNWRGSMEGWLLTPKTRAKQLPCTVPGLKSFYMVGQWISPGGGLPSGLITARNVIARISREVEKY